MGEGDPKWNLPLEPECLTCSLILILQVSSFQVFLSENFALSPQKLYHSQIDIMIFANFLQLTYNLKA